MNAFSPQPIVTSMSAGIVRCGSHSQHAESRRGSVSSRRRKLGMLKAEMMKHFDQNAAAAAALHDRIYQAENNGITPCDGDVLNDGIA